jgi:NAD(P)-dependent dehydrogenase (short-subunit alcohol dehydrogenase family)
VAKSNVKAKQSHARAPWALVTGASRGIGFATAAALADAGFDLIVTSTKKGGTHSVALAARRCGRQVEEVVYDACKAKDADTLAKAAAKASVIVLNAGIVVRKPISQMKDDSDFDDVIDVNLRAPFYLVRRLMPGLVKQGRGAVLFVSSVSATVGTAGHTGYCASKWGLEGLMKSVAEEVRGTGVFVASVAPGSVDTDMLLGSEFPAMMGPEDVARTITWLATDAPGAMHGSRVEMFG